MGNEVVLTETSNEIVLPLSTEKGIDLVVTFNGKAMLGWLIRYQGLKTMRNGKLVEVMKPKEQLLNGIADLIPYMNARPQSFSSLFQACTARINGT